MSYRTHSWPNVVDRFDALSAQVTALAPLGAAIARVAASPYATGLYPVQSMHALLLYQHDAFAPGDEHLRLDCEGGELVLRHVEAGARVPPFAVTPPASTWVKRGPDVIALLQRAFHHLRWFVEYGGQGAAPAPPA